MRKLLKEKRISRGMTQEQIAKEVGIARTTYTNIETGNKTPSLRVAVKLKEILDIKDDRVFFEEFTVVED